VDPGKGADNQRLHCAQRRSRLDRLWEELSFAERAEGFRWRKMLEERRTWEP